MAREVDGTPFIAPIMQRISRQVLPLPHSYSTHAPVTTARAALYRQSGHGPRTRSRASPASAYRGIQTRPHASWSSSESKRGSHCNIRADRQLGQPACCDDGPIGWINTARSRSPQAGAHAEPSPNLGVQSQLGNCFRPSQIGCRLSPFTFHLSLSPDSTPARHAPSQPLPCEGRPGTAHSGPNPGRAALGAALNVGEVFLVEFLVAGGPS